VEFAGLCAGFDYALDALMAEPGAFYVMDRGYLDLDGFNEEDLYSNLAWLPHRHG